MSKMSRCIKNEKNMYLKLALLMIILLNAVFAMLLEAKRTVLTSFQVNRWRCYPLSLISALLAGPVWLQPQPGAWPQRLHHPLLPVGGQPTGGGHSRGVHLILQTQHFAILLDIIFQFNLLPLQNKIISSLFPLEGGSILVLWGLQVWEPWNQKILPGGSN